MTRLPSLHGQYLIPEIIPVDIAKNMLQRFVNPAFFLGLLLLTFVFTLPGCGGSENDPEEQAKAIYSQAQVLETQGDILGALKEYDRLAAFPESQIYATARNELLKKGYSLGAGLESWTAKLLIEVENELIHQGVEQNPKDGLVVRLPKTDAWGQYLWVEYSTGPKYVFRIMSAGPDGKPDTGDELALYHKPSHLAGVEPPPEPENAPLDDRNVGDTNHDGLDEPGDAPTEAITPAPRPAVSSMEQQELNKYKTPTAVQAPREQLPAPGTAPQPPAAKPGSSQEQTVDLEDLL